MILCIDTTALKEDPERVQKDLNLTEIMKDHTKYFDSVEEAYKANYAPLDFSVSVRSIYTNLVLEHEESDHKLYYRNMTNTPEVIHKGYDLIMYMTSIGIMHDVDYKYGFDELMTKHTQFQCVGLFNPKSALINPIIYSHIIISDEGAEALKQFLKTGRKLVPISEMQKDGNLIPMLDTLIEVKEENKDGK